MLIFKARTDSRENGERDRSITMIRHYYQLAKPGIIYGNAVTVIAGFALASQGHLRLGLLLATLVGISLVVASGGIFNNYIDRDIDAVMDRTKNRVLVTGLVSGKSAIFYGIGLGFAGFIVLAVYTNFLTVSVAMTGFFVYVVLYSLWFKRDSHNGPLVGSIAGAVPPIVGYCAVTNNFDLGAAALFCILALWQIPHFYAIAIYRKDEYAAAKIPVLPIEKGIPNTKIHMLVYVIAFTAASLMPTLFGYTGYVYLVTVALLGATWIGFAIAGFFADDDKRWARNMFLFSIIVITMLSIAIVANALIMSLTI